MTKAEADDIRAARTGDWKSHSTAYVRLRRRFLIALLLYVGAILPSTLILIVFEGWPLIDSFYMSILTLTTLGYGEVIPLTDTGKILMSFVMILDISIFLYSVGILAYDLIDPDKRKISRIIELPMTTRFVMDEVTLTANSELIGKSILEANIRQKWGVFIPFIGSEGEDYEPHSDPNRVFRKNDHLWLFGHPDEVSKFIREAT